MRNKLFFAVCVCVVIAVLSLLLIGVIAVCLNRPVNSSGDTVLFTVDRGTSMHEISSKLQSRSLIRSG